MYFTPVQILSLILTSFHPHYDPTLVPSHPTLARHLQPNSDHLRQLLLAPTLWDKLRTQTFRKDQHISWSQVPPTSPPSDLATPSSAPEITYLTVGCHPPVRWQQGHLWGYTAIGWAKLPCHQVSHPRSWSMVASSIRLHHTLIAWVCAYPVCIMWEQWSPQLLLSLWRTGPSWDINGTIEPFSGWFNWGVGVVVLSECKNCISYCNIYVSFVIFNYILLVY